MLACGLLPQVTSDTAHKYAIKASESGIDCSLIGMPDSTSDLCNSVDAVARCTKSSGISPLVSKAIFSNRLSPRNQMKTLRMTKAASSYLVAFRSSWPSSLMRNKPIETSFWLFLPASSVRADPQPLFRWASVGLHKRPGCRSFQISICGCLIHFISICYEPTTNWKRPAESS